MRFYLVPVILLCIGLLVPAVVHRLHPIKFGSRAMITVASALIGSLALGLVMPNPPADHGLSKFKGEELAYLKDDLRDTIDEANSGGPLEEGLPGDLFLVVTDLQESAAGCGYETHYDVYLIIGWLDPKVDEVRTECGSFDG